MAVYFRHTCRTCNAQVVNDDKTKTYVHLATRQSGTKYDHPVVVESVRIGTAA